VISVSVAINAVPLYTRSARRIKTGKNGTHTYQLDTGETITHKESDGALALAKKMLDMVKEV